MNTIQVKRNEYNIKESVLCHIFIFERKLFSLVIPPAIASVLVPSSTLLATTPAYIPIQTASSSSLVTPAAIGGASSIPTSLSIRPENLPSSAYWDPNGYVLPATSQSTIIPSTAPGPVQRPNSSFSPAPGSVNNTTSRCIQRPSPEPRSCSTNTVPFPLYSPMNYAVGSSSGSAWNDTPVTNTHESQWTYPQEQQQLGSSTNSNDFPLYDPFHSGAGLTMPSSTQTLLTNEFSGKLLNNNNSLFVVFFL
jgi:hypothetical protein